MGHSLPVNLCLGEVKMWGVRCKNGIKVEFNLVDKYTTLLMWYDQICLEILYTKFLLITKNVETCRLYS